VLHRTLRRYESLVLCAPMPKNMTAKPTTCRSQSSGFTFCPCSRLCPCLSENDKRCPGFHKYSFALKQLDASNRKVVSRHLRRDERKQTTQVDAHGQTDGPTDCRRADHLELSPLRPGCRRLATCEVELLQACTDARCETEQTCLGRDGMGRNE